MTEQTHHPDPFHPQQTAHPGGPERARPSMPGALIGALVVLGFQVLANAFLGVVLLSEVIDAADHGREVGGLPYAAAAISLLVAAIGAMCIVLSVRPREWVRTVIIAIEAVAVLSGVISLLSGAFAAGAGIALAAGVIALLKRDEVRSWYLR